MFKICIPALCAALLGACNSVTPAGLMAAARLDPLETPPGAIAVALSVPENLRLADGDAELFLGFVPTDTAQHDPVAATVPLRISANAGGPRAPAPGQMLYVLGLSDAAQAQLAAAQDRIRTLKAQDVVGTGTLSIEVKGGCLAAPLDDELMVSTWLRSDPQGDFVPLSRRSDLFDLLSAQDRAALEERLTPC